MVSPEANRAAITGILEDAAKPYNPNKRDRAALKLRKERREAFVSKADELLTAYPQEVTAEDASGRGRVRLTRPVDVPVDEQTLQAQVIEIVQEQKYAGGRHTDKWIGLQTIQQDGNQKILFGVEEITNQYGTKPTTSTTIRTSRRGKSATNDQVLRGLQAINFLADQLANQPK